MTIATSGFDRVKALAEGRWDTIIRTLYPSIAKALDRPGTSRCACPIHASSKGSKADGFRVFRDFSHTGGGVCNTCGTFPTGIDLICFLDGQEGNPKHALGVLEDYFGLSKGRRTVRPMPLPKPAPRAYDERDDPKAIEHRKKVLAEIWETSVPLSELPDDHLAIRYLCEKRGIDDQNIIRAQKNLRFNAELFYARDDNEGPSVTFPGIVSMMHGADGRAVGLHRIFLDHNKPEKAPVEKAKKILGRLAEVLNGAVRLHSRMPFSPHANVCEGVETGMAIAHSTGHPVYAAGFTSLVASWVPPEGTKYVTIWADRDENEAGLNASIRLKARLEAEGFTCRILVPHHFSLPKEDWNDVLLDVGFDAIARAYSGQSTETEIY